MINDYSKTKQAIATGADPVWLCGVCPWTQSCLDVPRVDDGDVLEFANRAVDQFRKAHDEGQSIAVQMAEMAGGVEHVTEHLREMAQMAGRNATNETTICPVLAARLKTDEGRRIIDDIKKVMQVVEHAPMAESA